MSQNVSHPSRFQPKSEHSARKKPSPAGARLISILSIALLLFALVSCRSSSVQTPNSQDQQGYDATGDSRIQDDQLNQQNDSSPEPAEITFETVPSPEDPQQTFGVVTAYDADRQELWTYQTATVQEAQIAQNTSLGHHGDRYYILEDRHIVALNIQDGSVVWKNSETFTAPPWPLRMTPSASHPSSPLNSPPSPTMARP